MKDYLIIGCGLAGISFAETALRDGKTISVINNNSQNSSKIAGGMYNPVVLKRFSSVWNASSQLEFAASFYQSLEIKLQTKFDFKLPLLRKFYSVEEQNNWFIASDKVELSPFLSTTLVPSKWNFLPAPFSFGEVLHCGYLDTSLLLDCYKHFLKTEKLYLESTFVYSDIEFKEDSVVYDGCSYRHIVFAEGFGMLSNPFFKDLPMDGTKGEILIIKAPLLQLDVIAKSGIYIVPMGNDLYKVGATYNWNDKTDALTEEGKNELIDGIRDLITCPFDIIEHRAGVRPTIKDRRPLVGTHPSYPRLHILNGLGTRGVMLAPSMANDLYNSIQNGVALDKNIDIQRIKGFCV
jgi:glycine/D-amino acid oxidase-like deaminating enzyme